MGSAAAQKKQAAGRVGLSVEEYDERTRRGLKWCYFCRGWKARETFTRDAKRGDGLAAVCRPCNSARSTASRYGLRPAELLRLKSGSSRCPICKRDGQKLELDHNHTTGAVRSYICARCNHGIGHFGDDVKLLQRAIAYLRKHGSQ